LRRAGFEVRQRPALVTVWIFPMRPRPMQAIAAAAIALSILFHPSCGTEDSTPGMNSLVQSGSNGSNTGGNTSGNTGANAATPGAPSQPADPGQPAAPVDPTLPVDPAWVTDPATPVLTVTDLRDTVPNYTTTPGTLRWAIESAPSPAIIRFAVSGSIPLTGFMTIRKSNLLIDGGTAPGEGITVVRYQTDVRDCHDVIIRNMRFRSGDGFVDDAERRAMHGDYDPESLTFSGGIRSFVVAGERATADNIRIENCSIQNATDDNASVWGDCRNITFYRCVFSGGYTSLRKNMLCGAEQGAPLPSAPNWVTLSQCLFTEGYVRQPDMWGDTANIVNTVVVRYFQGGRLYYGKANIINNCFFTMPNHIWQSQMDRPIVAMDGTWTNQAFYVSGNMVDGALVDKTGALGIANRGPQPLPDSAFRADPHPGAPPVLPAAEALVAVLRHAGCEKPARDAWDLGVMDRAAQAVNVDPVTGGPYFTPTNTKN